MVSIVTARLLLPSQFGEAAIVVAITGFAQVFTDLGLTAAVVQSPRLTERYLSSAFWLNLGSGLVLTLLFTAAGFPLASLYNKPALVGLIAVASSNFVLSDGAVHTALLERTFHFKPLAIIETAAFGVGTAAVPVAAALGFGTYSLVLATPITSILLMVGLLKAVPWLPAARPSVAAVKEIWEFARGLVGFNSVNYWSRNLDNVLLGATVPLGALGYYSRAYNLMGVPIQQSVFVLDRVLYPALVAMRGDPKRMGAAWGRSMAAAGLVSLPITVTMAAAAPALIEVLYGSRWLGMTTVLELLSLSAVPSVVGAATGGAFRAVNSPGLLFRLGVVSAVVTIAAIVAGLPWGIDGVATALLIKSWLMLVIVMVPLAQAFTVPFFVLLRPVAVAAMPCVGLAIAQLAVRVWVPAGVSPAIVLIGQLLAGSCAYVGTMWWTHRNLMFSAREQFTTFVTPTMRRVRGSWR